MEDEKKEKHFKKIKLTGRPSTYRPEFCQLIIEFFNRDHTEIEETTEEEMSKDNGKERMKRKITKKKIGARLPTIERFCAENQVAKSTLISWTKDHAEFSNAYLIAKDLQADQVIQNGARGYYNAGFSKLLMVNLTDYKDESHQSVKADVVTTTSSIDLSGLSDEELDAIEIAKKAILNATTEDKGIKC